MENLDTIRRLTPNFFFWQGLRFVPLGLIILLFAFTIGDPPLAQFREEWVEDVLLAALVTFAVISSMWIGKYYNRQFGQVQGAPGAHQQRDRIKWLVAYPLMFLSLIYDAIVEPPLFVTGIIWSIGLVAYWYSTGRGRKHYLFAAVLMGILAFLPLFGIVSAGTQILRLFFLLLGLTYVLGGTLDHLELTRILKPIEDLHEADSV